MLVLSRKIGERIIIEPGIEIAILDVKGRKVRIGVAAADAIRIRRAELISYDFDDCHACGSASPTGEAAR